MEKTTVYPFSVGIAAYALIIALAYVQRDLTVQQLILILAAPALIGILSRGAKKGLMLSFLVSFAMSTVELIILQPGVLANPNVLMAVILMMSLPIALISAVLGAVGGLLGKRVLKSKVNPETKKGA